jgi:hypothetical protein
MRTLHEVDAAVRSLVQGRHPFIDTVVVQLRRKLEPSAYRALLASCGRRNKRNIEVPWGTSVQLDLHQPSPETMQILMEQWEHCWIV